MVKTMKIKAGKDGIWCASGNGNLRPIAAHGDSRAEAWRMYAEAFGEQQREEYHFEQSMSHLSLSMES